MANPSAMGEAVYSKPAPSRFQFTLRRREAVAAYLFLTPFLVFFFVFVLRSVVYALQLSFFDWKIPSIRRTYIGLGNYQELLADSVWWKSLENTVIMAVAIVVGTTLISLFAAVALNRPLKAGNFFRVLLYAPSLLSVGVVGTTWVWLLSSQFGIINYGLSLIGIGKVNWLGDPNLVLSAISLTSIWWGFGFPMLIFLAGLQGIPESLYEAARIDGANGRQLFQYITLPLLRPTILFVTVTGFIANFQIFGQNLILTNGGPGYSSFSVIFYLYQKAWQGFRMGYGAAIAIALAVIIMIFTVTQFRLLGRRVEY